MHSAPWWRPRTLSRQLTYGVAALVTVVTLTIGASSVYSLHTYVTTMSDAEVSHSLAAFEHSFAKLRAYPSARDDDHALTGFTSQAPGTLIAVLDGGAVVDSAIFSDGDSEAAPAAALESIEALDWSQEAPRTIKLGHLGNYCVASSDAGVGERLVSAVSLESADRACAVG